MLFRSGLPLNTQNEKHLLCIGGFIGRAIDTDLTGSGVAQWRHCMQVRVEIDINCPLISGFHSSLKNWEIFVMDVGDWDMSNVIAQTMKFNSRDKWV